MANLRLTYGFIQVNHPIKLTTKNPRALQPYATCITRPSASWWTRPTYCTNQQGISLQETGIVKNTVFGALTIPSRNGLPFQTDPKEILFVVLCIPRQVFTYSLGKILVGDRQEVQDKIFLSLTIWIPPILNIQGRSGKK